MRPTGLSSSSELLLNNRYSCCFCWNVATGTFFLGILGFATSLFFLLSMILAHFNYNIVPAAIGLINYGLLVAAEFSRRPSLYLGFMWINILGISFYSVLSIFLIFMLFLMPNWYVNLLKHHVLERGSFEFDLQMVQTYTILNLGFYVAGILLSIYAIYVVRKTYKFTLELQSQE